MTWLFSKCDLNVCCLFHTLIRVGQILRRLRVHWLYVPDHVRILLDTAITAEKSHAAHADNRLGDPLIVVLVRLIHQRMGFDVAIEVVTDEIVIPVVDDGVK